MKPVILIEKLTKRYGRRTGVEGLDFSVPDGSIFGFLGPNGAGKTTTIRVLMGFLGPSEGKSSVFGLDCWRDTHRIKREVGYLPGDLRLYPWLTCRTALSIVGRVRRRELRVPGMQLAETFGLEPDMRVRQMSRGTRQKLGLILALVHRPKVLILDEPTASLDPLMQQKLYAHLRELAAAGHTVFFSSHTLSEVERLCDRLVILREGRLMAWETLEALRRRAPRVVTIRWSAAASLDAVTPPPFLDGLKVESLLGPDGAGRSGRLWKATLSGPVTELVRWSASQPIEDLTIGQPDLTQLFQGFYAS